MNVAGRGAGDDVEAAAERWTQVRGPDARALADIEASFYKLVGGRRLGFLDPGFLRLVAHIGLGVPHRVTASLAPRACNGQAGGWGLLSWTCLGCRALAFVGPPKLPLSHCVHIQCLHFRLL